MRRCEQRLNTGSSGAVLDIGVVENTTIEHLRTEMKSLVTRLKQSWKVALPVGIVGVAVLAWLAFGFFGIQTLFIDDEVNEAGPVFESGAGVNDGLLTPDLQVEIDEAMAEDGTPAVVEVTDEEPMPAAPAIETLVSGDFVDHGHPTGGQAVVLTDGSDQRFLRFENFATDNGPDLNVYLVNGSADGDRGTYDDDFIDLGDLKGNIGPQNYEIPADVDLSIYDTVVIWCVRFSVSFGAADLA